MDLLIPISLFITMIVILVGYFKIIIEEFGTPPSLSDSYYNLQPNFGWLFKIFMFTFGISMSIISDHWLMYVSCFGMCLVGIFSDFKKNKLYKKLHIISAIVGIISSQLYILFILDYQWLSWLSVTSALSLLYNDKVKNNIIWQELIVFISICLALSIIVIEKIN